MRDIMTSECGRDFDHGTHPYLTPRGKVKACDGTKRKACGCRVTSTCLLCD